MLIKKEMQLSYFDFWSGARERAEQLTFEELDQIGEELETIYPEGIDETGVNDLFWFDFEFVCSLIGLELDENEDIIRNEK